MRVNYLKAVCEMLQMQLFYIIIYFFVTFTGVNLACLFWKMFTWGLFCFTYGMVLMVLLGYGSTFILIKVIDVVDPNEKQKRPQA